MSNTIFGKILERAFTDNDWRKYPGSEKIEGKFEPLVQETKDGITIIIDGEGLTIFPTNSIDDAKLLCYRFIKSYKDLYKIRDTEEALKHMDKELKSIKKLEDIKSFLNSTVGLNSVEEYWADDIDDYDEESKRLINYWEKIK